MSTERPSFGLESLLPQNYRSKAEAFAKCLQDKLKSLGGIDEGVDCINNGVKNQHDRNGVNHMDDSKPVADFPFDFSKFADENIYVQHPEQLYKQQRLEPQTQQQNGLQLNFLQSKGSTILDRRGYSSDSESEEEEDKTGDATKHLNGSATSDLVLNCHKQSEIMHKRVQKLINGGEKSSVDGAEKKHPRLASHNSEDSTVDSWCSCEEEPYESDNDDEDHFASQIRGSPRIRNPKFRNRRRLAKDDTWQKPPSPDVFLDFDVECFSPVTFEDAEDAEPMTVNQTGLDHLDMKIYDVPHRILRESSSAGNLERHFGGENGYIEFDLLSCPHSALLTPPPSPETLRATPEEATDTPIHFAKVTDFEQAKEMECEPKFCSTFTRVGGMILECPCEPIISQVVLFQIEESPKEISMCKLESPGENELSETDRSSEMTEATIISASNKSSGCSEDEIAEVNRMAEISENVESNGRLEVSESSAEAEVCEIIEAGKGADEVAESSGEIEVSEITEASKEAEVSDIVEANGVAENTDVKASEGADIETPKIIPTVESGEVFEACEKTEASGVIESSGKTEASETPESHEITEVDGDTETKRITEDSITNVDCEVSEVHRSAETNESASVSEATNLPENIEITITSFTEPTENSPKPRAMEGRRHSEDKADDDDLLTARMKLRRCSSLKTWKTPPGTPGSKKIVRFADALGLDLADIRTFLDEIPKVPSSAYEDLQYDNSCLESAPPLPKVVTLIPMFLQPGGQGDFLNRVRRDSVCLENAALTDTTVLTIGGCVRVRNLDYNKSVHVRYSIDNWRTFSDLQATYVNNSCDGFSDKFSFVLYGHTLKIGERLEFAVRLECLNCQYWDNNAGMNYIFQCVQQCPTNSIFTPITSNPEEQNWPKFY